MEFHRSIRLMYINTTARVVTTDGTSGKFEFIAGVLQGDTLVPFLFIVFLDYALRISLDGRERELCLKVLSDLDFADVITLF